MKVLLVGRLPSEEIGGVASYTALLAEALGARGCEVAVLHPGRPGNSESGSYRSFPAPARLVPGRRTRAYAEALAVRARAPEAIARFSPDVVHLQYAGSMDLLLPSRLARTGVPLLVTAHCGPTWRHLALAPRASTRRLLPADLLVCLGEAQARFFARAGFPPDRIRCVGTAIAEPFLAPPPSRTGSRPAPGLFLGRIAAEKGIETLLDALGRIAPEERPRVDLVGPARPRFAARLLHRIERLALGEAARLAGPVASVGERIALLDGADFYVHPSRVDATPLSVLEAMARGLPIVATSLPGTIELLGDSALLVPPGEEEPLAEAILALRRDPALRRRLGEGARRRAEAHTPERLATACLEGYADAQERRACASRT
jgi:glycosyltransferase involved in cell wall biosynthesis